MTNTTTAVRPSSLPQTDPDLAQRHSAAEFTALLQMVDRFTPEDWAKPTDCTEWTVRDMIAHLTGAAEEATHLRIQLRRLIGGLRAQRRLGGLPIDHTGVIQINDRAQLSNAELVADLRRFAATAPRGRRRQPAPIRRMRFPAVIGFRPGVNGSYAFDVIYTRDTWLHRVDLHRATGVELPTSEAEPEIVAQVLRDLDIEWRGLPFELTLTGRTPGTWQIGAGRPAATITEDTVAYLRLLSGRSDECTLHTEGNPEVTEQVRAARVVF